MDDFKIEFLIEACKYSYNSTCYKRNIGAVLVKNDEILSYGCSGANTNHMHCKGKNELSSGFCYWKKKAYDQAIKEGIDILSTKYIVLKREFRASCLSSCAERMAIANAVNNSSNIKNSVMYCTTFPCIDCAKAIRNHGINKIYYINGFDSEISMCLEAKRILDESFITQIQVECPNEFSLQGFRTNYEFNEHNI